MLTMLSLSLQNHNNFPAALLAPPGLPHSIFEKLTNRLQAPDRVGSAALALAAACLSQERKPKFPQEWDNRVVKMKAENCWVVSSGANK